MNVVKIDIQQKKLKIKEILFSELNILYSKKRKKNFYNKLYVEGSKDYRNCILNKGKLDE